MPIGYTYPAPVYRAILPSPFQMIQLGERSRQLAEEREMKRLQMVRDENAKALDKAFNYTAKPVISQYQGYFNGRVQQLYDMSSPLQSKIDPDTKSNVSREISSIEGELNIVSDVEQQMNTVRQMVKEKPNRYDTTWVNNNLYGSIYGQDGQLINPRQLDAESPYRLLQDYRAYNIAGLNEEFAKLIDEEVRYEFGTTTQGGVKFMQKWEKASKFAQLDEAGNPQYDKNGRLQISVTPESVNRYLQDDGRRLWAQEKLKEEVAAGNKDYTLTDAVEDLLSAQGYYKRRLVDQDVIDKSELNLNFIGGSAETDKRHRAAAEYFYNLVHGDAPKKKTLLGDMGGKDFTATYDPKPTVKEGEQPTPSKRGYVVINYDPISKFADVMDQIMDKQLKDAFEFTDEEVKVFKERARKDHKILVNLDDEEGAWRELNYWRNLARNQDINSDFLKQAYDEYAAQAKSKPGRFDNLGKTPKAPADDLNND